MGGDENLTVIFPPQPTFKEAQQFCLNGSSPLFSVDRFISEKRRRLKVAERNIAVSM